MTPTMQILKRSERAHLTNCSEEDLSGAEIKEILYQNTWRGLKAIPCKCTINRVNKEPD